MLDLQELQIIAQLTDNIEIIVGKLEKSYSEKDSEKFNESKREILKSQNQISKIIE